MKTLGASTDNCIFVKTILMLLVIIYHSCVFWTGDWFTIQQVEIQADMLSIFAKWLNTFHIYSFTLVSGYLFFYLKNEKEKYQEYIPFIEGKAKRLLIPYCFVLICWVGPISWKLFNYSFTDMFDKYILCTSPNQLWFLWMLFDVFLIVWPLNNIIKNGFLAFLVSIIGWGIGLICGEFFPNVFCILTALKYLPFFVLGMKLREEKRLFLYYIPKLVYFILWIGLFIINRMVSYFNCFEIRILGAVSEYCMYIVGAVFSFIVLQSLAYKIKWKKNKFFMNLAKKAMPMYLFHQQVIYFTIIWLNGKVNPYVNAIVNFIVSVVISYIISDVLMKFKWTRKLIGEK